MPPKLYGIEHIIYLVCYAVVFAACILIAHFVTKTDKQKAILLKSMGGVVLATLICNRISLAVWHKDALYLFPDSYCGMSSLLLGITLLVGKPHNKMFDFLFWLELVGGIACVFYPYFIGQGNSIFFLPTISGLLHHSLGVILCILLVQCKWFTPSVKRWKYYPIGLSIYTLYGLFLIDVCKIEDAMLIHNPIVGGTPLKWWFMLLVGSAVLFVYLFALEKYRAYAAKKKGIGKDGHCREQLQDGAESADIKENTQATDNTEKE